MKHPKIKKTSWYVAALAMILLSLVLPSQLAGQERQTGPREFTPHAQFIASTQKAAFADYAKRTGAKVANEKEFLRMKNHVLSMYEGVIVRNSFVMEMNGHVDCIDVNTQPSLRKGGKQLTVQKPPPYAVTVEERPQELKAQPVQSMLSREKKDRFGNVMYCESGFIPLRRITLDELTRFATLDDFFNKFGKAGNSGLPRRR
jgi:hypothetical protein